MNIAPSDLAYLAGQATSNSAILFVGAGFSADAVNKLGDPIPVGNAFCHKLWDFLGYPGEYDGTNLPTLFEAALKRKHTHLQRVLNENFQCTSIPDWYNSVPQLFWKRIYTTNVDNLIEQLFSHGRITQTLEVFNGITDDYNERDQFLERVQYVKLNGTLADKPTSITFSTRQYAQRLADRETWYDQFVRDYSTNCTIFVGSKLDEPLFWQAIEARGKKFGSESRPKSFIVSRSFSPAQVETLRDFNVVAITGTAKEFFDELLTAIGPLPTREDVVLRTNPGIETLIRVKGAALSKADRKHIEIFYTSFKPVQSPIKRTDHRTYFLLGAEPQWEDIYNDFDAPREFTTQLVAEVQRCLKTTDTKLVAITGAAGSGKSTVLKRTALSLVALGAPVFFTTSEELPPTHDFEAALDLLPRQSVLIFDNGSLAMGILPDYLAAANRSVLKHVFVIAGRTNRIGDRISTVKSIVITSEMPIPDLSLQDIDNIIDLLDRQNLLGRLANLPRQSQREVFLNYAHNQILVAMRRATLGAGFDDIIKNEFLTADPLEAKHLYLCAALVTEAEFTVTKQQLIACSGLAPAETLRIITENLRGVLIPTASNSDRYAARHRVIAELILEKIAPRPLLKEAYISFLKTLSHDLPSEGRFSSASFRLFRRLINHKTIFDRFSHHLTEARSIYSTVAPHFSRDYHFWLQFGSLELEYGELASAANYIEQAYQYSPKDNIVITTRAHLQYKQSLEVSLVEEAVELRDEARKILQEQMAVRSSDNYPFHIYCVQELAWIHRWLPRMEEKKQALFDLMQFSKSASESHSGSGKLKDAAKTIRDASLDLAKPGSEVFNPVL